eukprot:COSAG03_NODE_1949_length_3309_cov_200.827103_4_plen_183_part_00
MRGRTGRALAGRSLSHAQLKCPCAKQVPGVLGTVQWLLMSVSLSPSVQLPNAVAGLCFCVSVFVSPCVHQDWPAANRTAVVGSLLRFDLPAASEATHAGNPRPTDIWRRMSSASAGAAPNACELDRYSAAQVLAAPPPTPASAAPAMIYFPWRGVSTPPNKCPSVSATHLCSHQIKRLSRRK